MEAPHTVRGDVSAGRDDADGASGGLPPSAGENPQPGGSAAADDDPARSLARAPEPAAAGIGTWLRFLIGRPDAILSLAASKHAVWIGALFVLSAAFAREYDQEFILHRPWIMAVPFAASLVASLLLWGVLWLLALKPKTRFSDQPKFWRNYVSFLGLFWMTAPLAWLYAIPYERFLDPVGAVQANYATLGLVAAWRVWLMIRVARVWAGRSRPGATILVLLYGDVVLLGALLFAPWPVIDFMSGNNDPAASAELNIRLQVGLLAFFGLPLLLLIGLVHASISRERRDKRKVPEHLIHRPTGKPALRSLLLLAAASCLVWAPVLPFTQAEFQNKPTRNELRQQQREVQRLVHPNVEPG